MIEHRHRLIFGRRPERSFRRPSRAHRPELTGLETRQVLSVATFSAATGILTVNMGQNLRLPAYTDIDQLNGIVGIAGQRNVVVGAPGGVLRSTSVRQIVVIGSAYDDVIDLGKVSTSGFANLNGKVSISGLGGNDVIYGSQFGDVIDAGIGDDRIYGQAGDDSVQGGRGKDYLQGDNGNDLLLGGDDEDTLSGGNGDDSLDGGNGNDTLFGDLGRDRYYGGAGVDNAWEWSLSDYPLPTDIELIAGRRR